RQLIRLPGAERSLGVCNRDDWLELGVGQLRGSECRRHAPPAGDGERPRPVCRPRLRAERFAREPDGDAGRFDELQRDDQPDGRLQRPGHAERERAARRRQRQLRSEPGERIIDALGDDEREHADRYLYAHHYRGQRHPDPYHHGHTRREHAPRLHAERLAREPLRDALPIYELQRDDQPDGRLQWPGHAERERAARRRQRHFQSESGERVIDALGDDEREHADRYLYAQHYRSDVQDDTYHHGDSRRERAPRLHAERLDREPAGDSRWRDELRRVDQPDGRLQWPGHAERERAAQRRRQRHFQSEPGERVIDALGDDEREHADRYLYAHHYRGQRRPDAHHHGCAHGVGST